MDQKSEHDHISPPEAARYFLSTVSADAVGPCEVSQGQLFTVSCPVTSHPLTVFCSNV